MILRIINLSLLILYPIAWFAPLLRAGLLPIFGLNEISVYSGIRSLLATDPFLGILVLFFAIIAPFAKVIGTALMQTSRLPYQFIAPVKFAGRLGMADIFLVALYIVIAKGGVGVGKIEVAWGLYLFSLCVLTSLALSILSLKSK